MNNQSFSAVASVGIPMNVKQPFATLRKKSPLVTTIIPRVHF